MDKLHFLSDLREESREFLDLGEYTAIPLRDDQGLLFSIWLGQGTRFLPGLPVICGMQFWPALSKWDGLLGCLEKS
jgi:hypothetical protein